MDKSEILKWIRENQDAFPDLSQQVQSVSDRQWRYIRKHGFSSALEYVQFLYYMRFIKRYDMPTMCQIWGNSLQKRPISMRAMQNHLIKFGWQYTPQEGRQIAAKKTDYAQVRRKAQITRIKATLEKGDISGSKAEAAVRSLLNAKLQELCPDWECIVGLSNCAIVPPKEVDIPIMCYYPKKRKIVRIAVEINGEYWHQLPATAQNDTIKIPYIDKKFNLKTGFKSIHFNLKNIAMESGELHLEGYSSIQNLFVNNPKIASKDVVVKNARFEKHH